MSLGGNHGQRWHRGWLTGRNGGLLYMPYATHGAQGIRKQQILSSPEETGAIRGGGKSQCLNYQGLPSYLMCVRRKKIIFYW